MKTHLKWFSAWKTKKKWGPIYEKGKKKKEEAKIESFSSIFVPVACKGQSIGLIYSFMLVRADTGDTTLNSLLSVPALALYMVQHSLYDPIKCIPLHLSKSYKCKRIVSPQNK